MGEQQVMQMGVADQIRGLLTDQFWTVVGFVALGMVFGIATSGGARLFKYRLDANLPSSEYNHNALMLKRIAYVAGAAWTTLFLPLVLEGVLLARLLLAPCLGLIAGLGTPHMYDLLRWIVYKFLPACGRLLLERLPSLKLLTKKE